MASGWKGMALCIGWLGLAGLAGAQPLATGMLPPAAPFAAPAPAIQGMASDPNAKAPAQPAAPGLPTLPGFVPPPPQTGFGEGMGEPAGPHNAFEDKDKPNIPPEQFHISMDYLYWFYAKQPVPITVTTGSFNDLVPGALGQPNTRVAVGGNLSVNEGHNGGQLTLAYDFDPLRTLGIEVRGFIMEDKVGSLTFGGDGLVGSLAISRPFFNANLNTNDADPVALPSVMSGRVEFRELTHFYGGESNLRWNCWQNPLTCTRVAVLLGGRYLNLDQNLTINDSRVDLPGLGVVGNTYAFQDNFSTQNRFYGGQLGLETEWRLGPFVVTLVGKSAVGPQDMKSNISGATRITEPGGVVTTANDRAVLVQPSNAGERTFHDIGFVQAGDLIVGCDINDNIRVSLGYSFLYWTDVLRPGNQIDTTVNIQALQVFDQIGPARPTATNTRSDFWAQGLTASLMLSF